MCGQRRKCHPDFKRNAVCLADEPGRTAIEVADNPGISQDLLYKWRSAMRLKEDLVFPGHSAAECFRSSFFLNHRSAGPIEF